MTDPADAPVRVLPADPATRAALLQRIDALYADLAADVAATDVGCVLSGRCCDFLAEDHRLYATAAEIERARGMLHADADRLAAGQALDDALCPFWINRLCTAREVRPLGCRVYFCDPDYQRDHSQALYERYHRRLQDLLAEYGVPYGYGPFVPSVREAP